eukprot:GHVS01046485.1.p1 GENE.GHVS01046485.1~~GHVS01046485.1.p1  ORF type:complete len:141 (+),score=11.11 GHVS01046485.1:275-697(+)
MLLLLLFAQMMWWTALLLGLAPCAVAVTIHETDAVNREVADISLDSLTKDQSVWQGDLLTKPALLEKSIKSFLSPFKKKSFKDNWPEDADKSSAPASNDIKTIRNLLKNFQTIYSHGFQYFKSEQPDACGKFWLFGQQEQ